MIGLAGPAPAQTDAGPGMTLFLQAPGLIDIVAGHLHSCAVESEGQVWCWGCGTWGEIGDGGWQNRYAPVRVVGLNHAIAVGTGRGFACALRSAGTVACWGTNSAGQLGSGVTDVGSPTPVPVSGLTDAVEPALGADRAGLGAQGRHLASCGRWRTPACHALAAMGSLRRRRCGKITPLWRRDRMAAFVVCCERVAALASVCKPPCLSMFHHLLHPA